MEFRFNVGPLFRTKLIRVGQNLIPHGFTGDQRQMLDATSKMTEIINSLGEASARAQGLTNPVTSAQKLRNSEQQSVYLLAEDAGKNGCVVGLLKVGTKNLYIFDPNGETRQVSAPCVLDFYVHESRQRSGLGKQMFEAMLADQHYKPAKMAIDRPSEKLIGFFSKHYDLKRTIPQMNNFVVYDGFFEPTAAANAEEIARAEERHVNITNSPNTSLFGPHVVTGQRQQQQQYGRMNATPSSQMSALGQMPGFQTAPMGRFGAPRPLCSMSEIIHNSPKQKSTEPNSGEPPLALNGSGNNADDVYYDHHHHHVDALITATDALHFDDHDDDHHHHHHHNFNYHPHDDHPDLPDHPYGSSHQPSPTATQRPSRRPPPPAQVEHEARNRCRRQHYPKAADFRLGLEDADEQLNGGDVAAAVQRPSTELWLPEEAMAAEAQLHHFQHSKQHTGMKNMSFNVTAAVAPEPTATAAATAPVAAPHVRYAPAKTFVDAKPPQRQQTAAEQQRQATTTTTTNGNGMPAYRPVANQLCESAQIAEAQRQQQQRQAKAEAVLPDGVTEQGYFDLKFYHNKLCAPFQKHDIGFKL